MTEQDIELHRQAGWSDSKLIELVRADEREACAKVCEEMAYVDPQPHHYANAIRTVRARSQP